jgi:hypothetical protein
MGLFSNTWRAVTGKVSETGVFGQAFKNSLFNDVTIDYTRNDYDLYRSLYYGVSINGKAQDMLIGAMFAKPIINTTAGFAMGEGISVNLDDSYSDTQQKINDWIEDNSSTIQSFVIHGLRDGDSYLYIDEYGNLEELDAKTVTPVIDPLSGLLIGYDVEERYETVDSSNNKQKIVLVKQYRTDSVKYTQYPDNQTKRENGTVIYSKVYTVDGAITPTEGADIYQGDLSPRPLPIIHFANDVEPRSIYGNSELLNCLMGIRNYHAIVANATKGVINNANPIPVMKGVKNAEAIARQSNKGETEDTDKINWSPDTILFLENPESDAKYIQANGFMDDTGKLLEYYFALIVEASETPEFVFGTAVKSSLASVSEQAPVVAQKATRKRQQLLNPFTQMIESFVDRKIRMSDPVFLKLKNQDYDIEIAFPDIINEDKTMTLNTVKYLNEAGILSDETTLELLLTDKIKDPKEELDKAREDNEAQAPKLGAVPSQPNRLQDELNANQQQSTNSTSQTAPTAPPTQSEVIRQMIDTLDVETIREMTNDYESDDSFIEEFILSLDPEVIAETV